MKKKVLTELRAIAIIITIVLTIKVTLVEAYCSNGKYGKYNYDW